MNCAFLKESTKCCWLPAEKPLGPKNSSLFSRWLEASERRFPLAASSDARDSRLGTPRLCAIRASQRACEPTRRICKSSSLVWPQFIRPSRQTWRLRSLSFAFLLLIVNLIPRHVFCHRVFNGAEPLADFNTF